MKTISLFLVAFILVVLPAAAESVTSFVLTNDEGVDVNATFYMSEIDSPPAVLLVADEASGGRDAWAAFARETASRGKAVLVVEVRDAASATRVPVDNLVVIVPALSDIRAGIRYLREREDIDGVRVAVIGAGEATRAAVYYALDDLLLSGLCLLSPRDSEDAEDTKLAIHQSVRDFGRRPVLVIAARGDVHSMEVCDRLDGSKGPQTRVVETPGTQSGIELLDGFGPRVQLLDWLDGLFEPS
jgi:dienelactone hydrolase